MVDLIDITQIPSREARHAREALMRLLKSPDATGVTVTATRDATTATVRITCEGGGEQTHVEPIGARPTALPAPPPVPGYSIG
jgi:hypothetical protein